MNELVERLSLEQPIQAERGSTYKEFLERIKLGYIDILFTKTGTELGMDIITAESDLSKDNLKSGKGTITTVGYFILNYDKVKCTAYINLETLEGTGFLTPVSDEKYDEIISFLKSKNPYMY